ncbi:VOC family protein [Paenibacillus cisolokensis]|uniref:VOC family protein n=1 Tax=Paenibacillus cisolokensis TaxID=1658519 RepID=UPI003D2BA75C
MVRRYVELEQFDETVAFHEALIGQKARLRFNYPEYDLKLAQVASILFIAGTEKSLQPFTATHMTFLVDDIEAYARHLPTIDCTVLEAPKPVPTGWNMLVQHPDSTLIEYVTHHDKHPADVLPEANCYESRFD